MLLFWFDVLVISKAATDKVQGPFLNIGVSSHLIQACLDQFSIMRRDDEYFETILAKAKERCESLGIAANFALRRILRRRGFHDEATQDDPIADPKQRFKVDVYYSVLDIIINYIKTRFNDTTVGVINALKCLSPAAFIDSKGSVPSKACLIQLNALLEFYKKDLGSSETLVKEYHNMHALLNAWEFGDGEAVPRDHEDLLLFLIKYNLLDQFENIVTALKISLNLPVSSAHDERAFSCLKRVKTYLRSTISEKRLSDLACISINREVVTNINIRELQKPFLQQKSSKISAR